MERCPYRHLAAAAVTLGAAGCTEVTVTDPGTPAETLTLAWSLATRTAAVALTLGAAATAVFAWLRYGRRGIAALLVSGIFAAVGALVVPMMLGDRLVADSEGVHDVHGFPWDRRVRGFRYADVRRAEVHERRVRSGRSSRIERYWILHGRDGSTVELQVGDLWDRAEASLIPRLASHGVAFGPEAIDLGPGS